MASEMNNLESFATEGREIFTLVRRLLWRQTRRRRQEAWNRISAEAGMSIGSRVFNGKRVRELRVKVDILGVGHGIRESVYTQ